MSSSNQFSDLKPKGTPSVLLQEWTQHLKDVNPKFNQLFQSCKDNAILFGTNTERLNYPTSNLSDGQIWFESDTKLDYQWNSTTWQTLATSGGAVTNVTGTSPITSTGGATPAIGINLAGLLPSSISVLTNTSAVKTPGGATQWMSGSATITLTSGTWLVSGSVIYGNNGSNPVITIFDYVLATADGADSGSQPTAVTTNAGLAITINAGGTTSDFMNDASAAGITSCVCPIQNAIVAVASSTPIYLVPMIYTAGAIANARVVTNLWAVKISTATS